MSGYRRGLIKPCKRGLIALEQMVWIVKVGLPITVESAMMCINEDHSPI